MYDFRPGAHSLRGMHWQARTQKAGRDLFRPREWEGRALPSLDRIKREKGVWWMPWQQEAMKDVILCDKPWGAENEL